MALNLQPAGTRGPWPSNLKEPNSANISNEQETGPTPNAPKKEPFGSNQMRVGPETPAERWTSELRNGVIAHERPVKPLTLWKSVTTAAES